MVIPSFLTPGRGGRKSAAMKLSDFDFDLPPSLIATRPARPRTSARLLLAEGAGIQDRRVSDLPDILRTGDVLVLNDTKVIPARLTGTRTRQTPQGEAVARVEVTLLEPAADGWRALAKPLRKLREGEVIRFGDALSAEVAAIAEGELRLRFDAQGDAFDMALQQVGAMPLPPYIAALRAPDDQDRQDYQTVWAARQGAVAAPTASLHFDAALLDALAARGVEFVHVTLHVGAGTFLPVKVDDVTTHRMHAEWGEVGAEAADAINRAKAQGRRVIPVGTTALRLIESNDRHLHLSRPSLPGDRRADDEFPPAEIDAADAGIRADGAGKDQGHLCPCGWAGLSLLQLWRCVAVDPLGSLSG